MRVILTYDVSGEWDNIKQELLGFGFEDKIFSVNAQEFYNLPKTTLYHPNQSPFSAHQAVSDLASKYNVKLIRCVAFELNANNFNGTPGEPHTT